MQQCFLLIYRSKPCDFAQCGSCVDTKQCSVDPVPQKTHKHVPDYSCLFFLFSTLWNIRHILHAKCFFIRLSGIKRLRRRGSQSKSQIVGTAENNTKRKTRALWDKYTALHIQIPKHTHTSRPCPEGGETPRHHRSSPRGTRTRHGMPSGAGRRVC